MTGSGSVGGKLVVGLGQVDPALVTPHLSPDTRFVAAPSEDDLAVAVGAIVRADPLVDAEMLARLPNLRVLARTGVGVERVDVEAATVRGIAVVVTPGAGSDAVAEGALAMTLHLVKRLTQTTALVREGRWAQRGALDLGDLAGGTMGILGYGRIGRATGRLARAFGMTVLAYDPYVQIAGVDGAADGVDRVEQVELVGLTELAERSDVLSLHLPLTDATRHLVDAGFLAGVKPGAVLVNCGRGGLVDLDAVHDALVTGRLSGVGLDVFDPEPPVHHPIFDRDDVVLSPHYQGLTRRATALTFAAAARGVADVLAGRTPAAVANPGWSQTTDHQTTDHHDTDRPPTGRTES